MCAVSIPVVGAIIAGGGLWKVAKVRDPRCRGAASDVA